MKHFFISALFALLAVTAVAQEGMSDSNKNEKMTTKEKAELMEKLEWYYKMSVEKTPLFGSDEIKISEINVLPWHEWAKYKVQNEEQFTRLAHLLNHMELKAVSDRPNYCYFEMKGPFDEQKYFDVTMRTGYESNFVNDEAGHHIGFRQMDSQFVGLTLDVTFHLKTLSGEHVFIDSDPEAGIYFDSGSGNTKDDKRDAHSGMMFPLTVPFAKIADGYIDMKFEAPQQYEWLTVSKDDIGIDQSLCGKSFRLELMNDDSFVISASTQEMDRLEGLGYYCYLDGKTCKSNFTTSATGNLENLTNDAPADDITFEQWLADKGIDPNNLEETISNLTDQGNNARIGKSFTTYIDCDSLLLYMPADSADTQPIATARVYIPKMKKSADISVDHGLVALLQSQIQNARLLQPDNEIIVKYTDELTIPTAHDESEFIDISEIPDHSDVAEVADAADSSADSEIAEVSDVDPTFEIADVSEPSNRVSDEDDNDIIPPAGPELDALIRSAKAKLTKEHTAGLPPSMGFDELTRREADALLADNDEISYAAGVIAAQSMSDMLKDQNIKYHNTEERQPMYEWFDKGMNACKKAHEAEIEAWENQDPNTTNHDDFYTDLLNEELTKVLDNSKNETNIYNAHAFEMGYMAFASYCLMAPKDEVWSSLATGRRLDIKAARNGFHDFFERSLTRGLQYCFKSLPQRRMVKALNCNEDLEPSAGFGEDGLLLKDFKPAVALNPVTNNEEDIRRALQRTLTIPTEALENGLSGKVLLEIVAEADGAISEIVVKSSPDPILSRAAVDAIYRIYMKPAMLDGVPVAFKMSLPVIFAQN